MSFASSQGMAESRPEIDANNVWCEICGAPVEEFDESALHNLWGKPDKAGNHRGYIVIRAYCHGEEADMQISFTDARANAGKRMVAFAAPVAIQETKPPLMLMSGGSEPSI